MSRKNSSSEIPQFTFDEHHHSPRIDSTRTHQAAFAAQHAFVHLFIDALIFAPAHERMEFAEIEIRKVAGRTGRRTAAAADAGLQFGHLAQDLVALAQVVAVDVDGPGLRNGVSEIDRRHCYASTYLAAASAAAMPSFSDSPMFLGAVMVPA